MITFENIERNYEIASKDFSLDIPEIFNFGFDVLDVRAQEADKEALLAIDTVTGKKSSVTYSELSKVSSQFGKALLSLGLKRGDAACVLIMGILLRACMMRHVLVSWGSCSALHDATCVDIMGILLRAA